ncbi:MarR family transcriptional regulator [Enterococcus hulanensis]|uniref:MarR family transcriptional regulator n=1 Tax=Enterococcus hulanensis TaxID=2559929 RepID=A0ABU3EUB8_9ENTE|nr:MULTISPECIES: MarR family transcriptional regulator [Enterococcus]MBO0410482.1 MarR family transcriptional regulator [Enterococcus hulanensis]MDT2598439.1 MarR family transcriptional regulator [Enterococcus hulanensis]MDT2608056.1 MarR family transcriptional regulator [Enterococcus hulanensis]MDT2615351.1 MarR family transcriptional regulator [Enterococcus hulanensis]MDT2626678.1 MarR family transcriptional regulator [Enterococcus hulanensis]
MDTHEVRKFNRYYTRILGVFDQKVFNLDYSMIEMRILGEIGRHPSITANELTKYLNIKKSYLSRKLSKLERDEYIFKEKNSEDSRILHLYLSEKGLELNKYVEEQSDQKVLELLEPLDSENYQELVAAMKTIEKILYKVVPNELENE